MELFTPFQQIVLEQASRYPGWLAPDLYKLIHQAALGSGHAVNEHEEAPIAEQFALPEYHHYWTTPHATQYCSFQRKKDSGEWLALHNDAQHDTLTSLGTVVDRQIDAWCERWAPASFQRISPSRMDISFYHPILVLQGELYAASLRNGRSSLQKAKHLVLKHRYAIMNGSGFHCIVDIVVADYLPSYLELVNQEMETLVARLHQDRDVVWTSMQQIANEITSDIEQKMSVRAHLGY